jgi:folylpolyglutamate synthase/dihydropteroate synthase
LQLLEQAESIGLSGNSFGNINEAYSSALSLAAKDDVVLVVGSFFILSELEVIG